MERPPRAFTRPLENSLGKGWGQRDTTYREHCILKPKRYGGQSGQRHHFQAASSLNDANNGAQLLAALDPGGHPGSEQPLADHMGDEGADEDAHHHQSHAQHEAVQVAGGNVEHDVAPAAGERNHDEAHDEEQDPQQRVEALHPEQEVLQVTADQGQGSEAQRGQHAHQQETPAPTGAAEAAAAPVSHLRHADHHAAAAAAPGAARQGPARRRQLRGRWRTVALQIGAEQGARGSSCRRRGARPAPAGEAIGRVVPARCPWQGPAGRQLASALEGGVLQETGECLEQAPARAPHASAGAGPQPASPSAAAPIRQRPFMAPGTPASTPCVRSGGRRGLGVRAGLRGGGTGPTESEKTLDPAPAGPAPFRPEGAGASARGRGLARAAFWPRPPDALSGQLQGW